MDLPVSHKPVLGSVNYANPGTEPLYWRQYPSSPGERETNIEFIEHLVPILDARQRQTLFRLDVEGAAVCQGRSAVRDFDDEDELRRVGYAEAAAIAQTVSCAKHAFVFDHNIRRGAEPGNLEPAGVQKPVFHIHTDFSSDAAPRRVRHFAANSAGAAAKTVLRSVIESDARFAVLNVWRPIIGPVEDSPLALCDASSVCKTDLLAAALLYPDREGEIYYLKFNPAHRWWYLPDMRPDEAWVFKNYDSAEDGRARFTPHTAFIDTTRAQVAPRHSIEFRTFVVF